MIEGFPPTHRALGLIPHSEGEKEKEKKSKVARGLARLCLCDEGYHHCYCWEDIVIVSIKTMLVMFSLEKSQAEA